MKFRLTYVFALLVLITASLPLCASTGVGLVPKFKRDLHSSGHSRSFIASYDAGRLSHAHSPEDGTENSGTQLRQSVDVVIHGSLVPVCDVILSLIAVLYFQKAVPIPELVEAPARRVLFKDLFQVIIAPNAP